MDNSVCNIYWWKVKQKPQTFMNSWNLKYLFVLIFIGANSQPFNNSIRVIVKTLQNNYLTSFNFLICSSASFIKWSILTRNILISFYFSFLNFFGLSNFLFFWRISLRKFEFWASWSKWFLKLLFFPEFRPLRRTDCAPEQSWARAWGPVP